MLVCNRMKQTLTGSTWVCKPLCRSYVGLMFSECAPYVEEACLLHLFVLMCLRIMCVVFVCPQRGHTLVRLKYTASYLRRYAALSKPSFNFFNSSVKVLTLLDIFFG